MMHARRLATHLRALPRPASLVRPASLSPRHVAARPFVSSLHNIAFRLYSTEQEAKPSEGAPSGAEGAEAKAGQSEAERKAAALEEKVKSLEKDVLYHRAEIQTLNRRVSDERAKASEFAITSFARSLLSTSDVLSTALAHVPKPIDTSDSALSSLVSGVELTQKAMFKTFAEAGVKKIEVAQGTAFDPNLHEATFQIPKEVAGPKQGGGEWAPGQVVEISKEGWMIGNRVLRPAQVGVTQME